MSERNYCQVCRREIPTEGGMMCAACVCAEGGLSGLLAEASAGEMRAVIGVLLRQVCRPTERLVAVALWTTRQSAAVERMRRATEESGRVAGVAFLNAMASFDCAAYDLKAADAALAMLNGRSEEGEPS